MTKKEALLFLEKLVDGRYSEEEYSIFLKFLKQTPVNDYTEIIDRWQQLVEDDQLAELKTQKWKFDTKYLAVAAIIIAVVTIGVLLFSKSSQSEYDDNVIVAGTDNAVLTLSDGREILLEELKNGEIASIDGIKIIKSNDGQLIYEASSTVNYSEEVKFNKITTPRGGQYQIKLPDGTKVWLNAESSIKYPTYFSGEERIVELAGEGYFEVSKDPNRPFKVQSGDQLVTVLGTHFNINSYDETDHVTTTVVEGSVRVEPKMPSSGKKQSVVVRANQQSLLNIRSNKLKVNEVEASLNVAWKNGKFQFQNTPIAEVLQQFSRWYNVDFEYVGSDAGIKLWGDVNRNVSANEALEILHFFELKYTIVRDGDSKKIIVTK